DGPADLGCHVGAGAVVGELDDAWAVAYQDVLDDAQRLSVDDRDGVSRLGRDVHPVAVGADGNALGFDADPEVGDLFTCDDVVAGALCDGFERSPDVSAVGAGCDALRVAACAELADYLVGAHVDADDLVFGSLELGVEVAY